MYCSKCGTKNSDAAVTCSSCNASLAKTFQADAAREQVKIAATDAWDTFKKLGIDPVGGLQVAFEGLGPARAAGVGVAFGLVFALCLTISVSRIPFMEFVSHARGGGFYLKMLLIAFIPYVSLALGSFVGEKVGKGRASLPVNAFVAGVAALPLGLIFIITSLIGVGNFEISTTLIVVGLCMNILVLFAGLTRLGGLTDKSASYAVPLILVISAWIAKIFYSAIFT